MLNGWDGYAAIKWWVYSQRPLKAVSVYKGHWSLDSLASNRASGHGPLTQCEEEAAAKGLSYRWGYGWEEGKTMEFKSWKKVKIIIVLWVAHTVSTIALYVDQLVNTFFIGLTQNAFWTSDTFSVVYYHQ